MTKSFSKDANILSLEEEEIIKGLDYPVSLFMDTLNEVIKQKYTNSLSKSFMTHESILISGRETLLSKKYDKESTHNKWIEILYKRSKWCLLDSQLYLNQEKVKSRFNVPKLEISRCLINKNIVCERSTYVVTVKNSGLLDNY
ncbi:unnamed protein product [Rhizophagus irregularis]|nr:unnamed protein product [Rhizophagus irregularis]